MKPFYMVDLTGLTILQQLQLEEALLRTNKENWCLLNTLAPDAIVLGISAIPHQLVNFDHLAPSIPLIKRFSGGGTVYIDPNTIFVTFIASDERPATPSKIMQWTKELYHPFFAPYPFELQENDYVLNQRKIGGNAQYIQRGRWLHHTSFLWSFDSNKMKSLKMPPKTPSYRQNRSHNDFLTSLSHYYENKELFIQNLKGYLCEQLTAQTVTITEAQKNLLLPHRKSTILI